LGGYGNFGSYIARSLGRDANIQLLIAGRSAEKARTFAASLDAFHSAESHALDICDDLTVALARIAPDIVIHTTGPFQTQDHRVARVSPRAATILILWMRAISSRPSTGLTPKPGQRMCWW
jgi:saccharopine dehydrogenase-like NADP-dependent oxidoreductase